MIITQAGKKRRAQGNSNKTIAATSTRLPVWASERVQPPGRIEPAAIRVDPLFVFSARVDYADVASVLLTLRRCAMRRHWRIAFSILCLALLLATLVMWVRSYRWLDAYSRVILDACDSNIVSCRGDVTLNCYRLRPDVVYFPGTLISRKMSDSAASAFDQRPPSEISILGIHGHIVPYGIGFGVPYWFVSVLFAAIGGLPWYGRYVPVRFGLRTLLILFTIVAALLGYIVWAVHSLAGP
jgi:hypothetical protein